jgi:glycerol-3-phosphate dehydrogenase (NAD(P)+)
MNISVMGCGRWGTFIAWYLDKLGHDVLIWGRENSAHLKELRETRRNEYLTISDSLTVSSDLQQAVTHCDIMIISISAQGLRDFLKTLSPMSIDGKICVLCMKGLENHTGFRLTQVVHDVLGNRIRTAVWVGPGHVQDFEKGIPNCMVIDSDCDATKKILVDEFSSELIRFYYGSDLIGTEVGAATKNVIGIAAGVLDGLGLSSLKGGLIARGTREISRLIKAMGGNELTAYGLAHLGDYAATVFSEHSHNRQSGESLVTGQIFGCLAEGVETAEAVMQLKEIYQTDLPICTAVHDIIKHQADPKQVLSELFLRSIKDEFG